MNAETKKTPGIANQIVSALKGRIIVQCVILNRPPNNKIYLWGMQDSHTLVIHLEGNKFMNFKEHDEPLGIVEKSIQADHKKAA